ncbi:MAG: phosphotransferase family protein [Pyrinomonadaceae bacterium]
MSLETSDVRHGEELPIDRLADFLQASSGLKGPVEIKQFPAGSSNLTYSVKFGADEFVLRRPPFGNKVKTAHDMRREFEVLSKLSAVYQPAPKPILFCGDDSVIGSEFFLMERRRGLIIRGQAPKALESPQLQRAVCESFVENLAALHELDYNAADLTDLGHPAGYCRRQVEGWTNRYSAAKTHEWPELENAIIWLNENIPPESGASLIHNDYKFDNIMLDPDDLTKITAVLDWEMVTIGDPLMDLGTTLGYWMSRDAGDEMLRMPFNPRVLMENIPRDKLVEMYAAAAGRDVSNVLFYYIFGTFKIAVIAQQIYARFARGSTQDGRFAAFGRFAGKLGQIAVAELAKEKLSSF